MIADAIGLEWGAEAPPADLGDSLSAPDSLEVPWRCRVGWHRWAWWTQTQRVDVHASGGAPGTSRWMGQDVFYQRTCRACGHVRHRVARTRV